MRVLSEVPSQLLIIRAACVLPIILTARDQISDRIEGLNAGADYLVKPFDLVELSARIHAVARRYGHSPEPSLKFVAGRNGRIRLSAHSHRLDTKLTGQPFN